MYNINYETVEPLDIMQILKTNKDKERIDKILGLWIFKATDWELKIQSYKCITEKKVWNETRNFKNWFPFHHQIFWFALMEMKDLDFAITEVKRVLEWERQYLFPNWTLIQLDK